MLLLLRINYRSVLRTKKLVKQFSAILELSSKYQQNTVTFSHRVHFKKTSLPSFKEGSFGSRYCPPSATERAEEKIKNVLTKGCPQTFEEWNELKTQLMDDIEILTDINFSTIIMGSLLMSNKIIEAHSFMNYLKESKLTSNFLTYLKYMALCGVNIEQCGQEVILQTFQKVKFYIDSVPVLDLKSAEYVVQGISATDQWQLCFDYLKKVVYPPNTKMKNSLAAAAIRNGDEPLAWDIITKWLKKEDLPNDHVLTSFLKHALRLQNSKPRKSDVFIVKIFEYIQGKDIVISKNVARLVEKYFRCHSDIWSISYTKVDRKGECNSCKNKLKLMDLSAEEFEHLRKSFLEKSLKKADLFINSTEKEFNQFIKFIESRKPFDIVIDGLNAAFTGRGAKNNYILAKQLLKVVDELSQKSRKLLVLGRNHMTEWPRSIMHQISKRAILFRTTNISQDDPFLVCAALESGPHCYIVSSDLMRDHVSRLDDPNLISLFKRWQLARQVYLLLDDDGNQKFVEPVRHSINIQGSMKEGWHIPFDDKIILEPYEELNNWLCIKKPTQ